MTDSVASTVMAPVTAEILTMVAVVAAAMAPAAATIFAGEAVVGMASETAAVTTVREAVAAETAMEAVSMMAPAVDIRDNMEKTIIINERLPGLNDYIAAERTNRFKAAKMKSDWQEVVVWAAKTCLGIWTPKLPVRLVYRWYEKNRRRDKDNIAGFGHKVIQDALVIAGILPDDGWKEIEGFEDYFEVDRNSPRVEVTVKEVEKDCEY